MSGAEEISATLNAGVVVRIIRKLLRNTPRHSYLHRGLRVLLPATRMHFDGWIFETKPRVNYTDYRLFLDGVPPEYETYRYFKQQCVGKHIQFVDIGANSGIYSIPASFLGAPGTEVISFEPNPKMRERLERNIKINELRNIRVFPVALGDTRGRGSLSLPAGRVGNHGRGSLLKHRAESRSIQVDVEILSDQFLGARRDFDVRIIKADVEGFEDRALYRFFRDSPLRSLPNIVIIEVAHSELWEEDLLGLMAARGFVIVKELDGNAILERDAAVD